MKRIPAPSLWQIMMTHLGAIVEPVQSIRAYRFIWPDRNDSIIVSFDEDDMVDTRFVLEDLRAIDPSLAREFERALASLDAR